MRSTVTRLALALLAAMLPLGARAAPLCSVTRVGPPTTVTAGIVVQPYTVSCPDSARGGPKVGGAAGNMHLVTVDLATPRLSVRSSVPIARSGTPPAGTGAVFAVAPTSAVFASSAGKVAGGAPAPQIAINANLFTICCTTAVPPPAGKAVTKLRGLQIADGRVFVPPRANGGTSGSIPYATFASSLTIDRSGHGRIWTAGPAEIQPGGVVTAVTGSHLLVGNGRNVVPACTAAHPCAAGRWLGPNARTGVGLNGSSSLVLVVVDGTDNATGLSLYQFGDVLAQISDTAINLDGGGSSTMVSRGGANGFTILNKLTGAERDVGAVLYVQAP